MNLDLNISFNKITNKLNYSVYVKPTNNFSYLKINSNHPTHIFKNIPKSLFIRNRRICSDYLDYVNISKRMIEQLLKRGYEFIDLIKMFKIIGNTDRNSLLPYKKKDSLVNKNQKVLLFEHL